MGKGLFPTLKKYATDIDVLIIEGTMLKRDDKCIHEREVSQKMACVMQAFKYVFALASATDIERLATIKEAAKSAGKPLYIWSLFMKRTMGLFTERESKLSYGLFAFTPLFYRERLYRKLKRKGFAMIVGTSQIDRVRELLDNLPQGETLLIYSSWDGYYKDPEQVKVNPKYKEYREMFHNVVDIHTSGHADRSTIKRVVETIHAKEVICIHKEADAEL
jgi:ribonuclease J